MQVTRVMPPGIGTTAVLICVVKTRAGAQAEVRGSSLPQGAGAWSSSARYTGGAR